MKYDKKSSMVIPVRQKAGQLELLALRRADNDGAWSFLTERVDDCDNSCLTACAYRGVKEELGIDLLEGSLEKFYSAGFRDHKDRSVRSDVFLLPVSEFELGNKRFNKAKAANASAKYNEEEVASLKWVTPEEACSLINHKAYELLYSTLINSFLKE